MSERIAVLTSGGDAPGMNAAIRAIVRVGIADGLEVFGVRHGLQGLIDDDIFRMNPRDVSNIIQRGGTILHTARSKEFMEIDGQQKAADNLRKHNIDGLLAIGGDGTFHGLVDLEKVWDGQIIGLPGTIASGAEEVILPDFDILECDQVARKLEEGKKKGKMSGILIVSERGKEGGVYEIAKELDKYGESGYRVTILGHIQRGGSPTARDRVLATKLGAYAVRLFQEGATGVMAGEMSGKLVAIPLKDTWTRKQEKPLDKFLLEILEPLAI